MLSRSRTSNDEGVFGVADGAGDGETGAFEGDGDPDGDADGETGAFGVEEGDADGDPVFGADGTGDGLEDQLTPIDRSAAPTGSM
jgi:hypothetical protein